MSISRKKIMKMMAEQDMSDFLLVDTYNGAPANMKKFEYFNPFYTWPSAIISVPGAYNEKSTSIEAIWQGTKIIHGKTDFEQFKTMPYKRPPESLRDSLQDFSYEKTMFTYHNKSINHLEARFLIYLIAYLRLLNEHVPDLLIQFIMNTRKKSIIFYDWDDNFEIENVAQSFSHSAILASWFKNTLEKDFLVKAKKFLSKEYFFVFSDQFYDSTKRYRMIHEDIQ